MRLKLTVAYDGSGFSGWQSQRGGVGVQDAIEKAAAKISGLSIRVHGAGRTDAGVHALGQCCHLDVPDTRMTHLNWQNALNAALPPGLRVMTSTRVSDSFHARFSAQGKIYRYAIFVGSVLPPHEFNRSWHIFKNPDLGLMKSAAEKFIGRHDFAGFSANRGTPVADTCRIITKAVVTRRGPRLFFTVQGNGFLYKMVRMMTSAVVQCGQGEIKPDRISEVLNHPDRRWSQVAPAQGLFLVRVIY